MAEPLTLLGYGPSVYTRIARMALAASGQGAQYVEVDPFAAPPDPRLAAVSPFGRVPVLVQGDFILTETSAITRHLMGHDAGKDRQAAARREQVIAVLDAYGYWPLVRQIFVHGYFATREGAPSDPQVLAAGLRAAQPVLNWLDGIVREPGALTGPPARADLHLLAMLDYLTRAPEGAQLLATFADLSTYWAIHRTHPLLRATDPL
ncbi:glutathione S-transferase [Sulfitobacter albidus]|uniref:Glutathione S-transferase n=1 Tax=Sulfitobacter albidus TaxID=2829501 RepID=A0A975JCG9_9RHOB|nr:glutathione S-transferase family protein [Sulfitobacter albidus]QUJ75937.1 glutathione S-transferase [Sulfitobacter albidus]